MKKRMMLVPGALLLACLAVLGGRSRSSPAGIARFVLSHRAELEAIAADCLGGDRTAERYKGAEVEGVFPGENPIVQFSTVGWELVPVSDDQWTWSDGTDNGGVTRRIDGHWFSYQAWF